MNSDRKQIQIQGLDPGIVDIVMALNAAGFDTTDSGDGVSKPAEWFASGDALPFRHVVAVTAVDTMVSEARRLAEMLGAGWIVEANYSVPDGNALLFARER